mmetsp:Transcript_49179/g.96412  ORF Transcript_49179/g.96412 Transcript_49179/m.96412 type:complete len:294 (+) Transcript_49179:73-954(+)
MDEFQVLAVIIDTFTPFWAQQSEKSQANADTLNYSKFCENLLVFINSFLVLNRGNAVAVISANESSASFVFPDPKAKQTPQNFNEISKVIKENLRLAVSVPTSSPASPVLPGSLMAGALSTALCYIEKQKRHCAALNRSCSARILALPCSPDLTPQYVHVMNTIFFAQKQNILVDACPVGPHESLFWQQAAHLTGGIYYKPPSADLQGLLQHLLVVFLSGSSTRGMLVLPTQTTVDYRATCFCHKKVVDKGHVCPVCLSIFCLPKLECSSCKVRFPKVPIRKVQKTSKSSSKS